MANFPPQHANETPRAYAAFTAYCGLGPDRSLAKTRHVIGKESAGYTRTLELWSVDHDWQARVRTYDQAMAQERAAEISRRYLADLEDHRDRYGKAGKALHGVAVRLLSELNAKVASIEMTPATLATVARALTTAADLEAHALGIDELLPRVRGDEYRRE